MEAKYTSSKAHDELSIARPDPSMISYEQYVRKYYSVSNEENKSIPPETLKAKKYELFENFVKPGSPGVKFKKISERMEKALVYCL